MLGHFDLCPFQHSGARAPDVTGHCVWSHDAGAIMQQSSHLNLMSMGCLQACSFFFEQTPHNVTIDVNKFLEAFSIEVDGQHVRPPTWEKSENNAVMIRPSTYPSFPPSSESSTSPPIFNMDDYRRYRQAEALCWIDLQEKRASIIARLQPTSKEEYQKLRDAVTSETGPLRRKPKKQIGTNTYSY
jgi:hypothetical protein